ncbi:MAG TPA: alpha-L-fucosidase [Oscillospiraceae bacterium]|nr:alpha-L-fucosidase [Oscillospiraceae bacterium]
MQHNVRETPGDTSWFVHDRFGMFIHWGIYALPARHEWVKSVEKTPEDVYQRYFDHFNPDMYEPKKWAEFAKNAGMKYVVLTSKHHDGFCLFDSAYTEYKSTNTPYGKDLVKEYVEAFRAEGIKVGFYYSLIDWHHPDFPLDIFHPRRDDENAKELNEGRDMKKYAEYMRNQVTELLTNYGNIDIIWFDFSYANEPYKGFRGKGKDDWEAEKLIKTVRDINPDIIINNRTDIEQDLWTPEQMQPDEWVKDNDGNPVVWEACQTFSGSWGYYRDEMTWKSPEVLIRMLIKTVSLGGNLLLNVGPTARGYFDSRAEYALTEIGKWMKYNSKSIYGCTQSNIPHSDGVKYTQNGKMLYAHIFTYPAFSLKLKGLAGKIAYAQLLNDASEVQFEEKGDDVHLSIPRIKPDQIVPVVEIFLN